MARQPDQRHESAADFARGAARCGQSLPTYTCPVPPAAARRRAPTTASAAPARSGPGRRARSHDRPRRRRWRIPALGAVGAVAIGAVFLLRDDDDADRDECPSFEPVVTTVSGDPEGDGTPTDAAFQLEQDPAPGCAVYGRLYVTIAGEERTFRIGEPGDQLLLGDWDCDGIDTPAVYRPATGEVAYHDGWPASGEDRRPSRASKHSRPRGTPGTVRGRLGLRSSRRSGSRSPPQEGDSATVAGAASSWAERLTGLAHRGRPVRPP